MTLVELLVAMVVLLVGIYTVARGFPLMLYAIRGEGDRTAMTRLAEQTLTRLSDSQGGLPDAITGGGGISPESMPEDITGPHISRNALQDVTEVRGEGFRVPAPYRDTAGAIASNAPGYYVLAQGPSEPPPDALANWATGYPYVYMLVPLTERTDDPTGASALSLDSNWFHVNHATGEVTVPASVTTFDGAEARVWPVSNVVVDYAWCTPTGGAPTSAEPVMHYVQGELPTDVTPYPAAGSETAWVAKVHPARLTGGITMAPGQTRAWARVDFVREPFGTQFPTASGRYVLDNTYGVRLAFHPADVGLTLKVDYQLRTIMTQEDQDALADGETVTPRRLLLMAEDQTIESATTRRDASQVPFGDIRLAVKHVDDQPIFSADLQGTALTSAVHVLAVDLQTGEIHTDGSGFALEDTALEPELENGYNDGVLTFPLEISGAAADYLGHTWRFFYRTLDRHTVQVLKAPRTYVDAATAQAYLPLNTPGNADETADVDYRTYQLTQQAAPDDPACELAVLEFGSWLADGSWSAALSSSGMTVAVSYSYVTSGQQRETVWGELHTVPVGGRKITLNRATLATHPIHVLAVNGVSARARGWWMNQTGRSQTLELDTVFLANTLGALPRVR